ncbi:MAG: acyltransferase 3 [Acidimicrobiales bacterium]|nr:acyltransferase 3 [Acidimicrobiales bacterium]
MSREARSSDLEAAGGLESSARTAAGGDRFPAFDGYRAIAATAVLALHVAFASGFIFREPGVGGYFFHGDVGVAIFFVISGFLLYRPFVLAHLTGRPGPALRPFARRRLLRIFPAYWVALTVIVYVFQQQELNSVLEFVLVYGLLQIYDDTYRFSGLAQAWSLCTELSFYAFLPAYAIVVRAAARRRSPAAPLSRELRFVGILIATGFASRWILVSWLGDHSYSLTTLPVYLHLFGAGMGLAVLSAWQTAQPTETRVLDRLGRRAWPWWLLAATAYWSAVTFSGFDFDYAPSSAGQWVFRDLMFLIVATGLLVPGVFAAREGGPVRSFLQLRPVQLVGLVSYGIYLWHEAAIELVQELLDQPMFTGALPTMLAVSAAVSLLLAGASYIVVERPALSLKDRRRLREP